jgi:two-component system response regulator
MDACVRNLTLEALCAFWGDVINRILIFDGEWGPVYEIILLVEDDPEDEAITLRAVRKHVTQSVVVARDGSEALDFLFGTGDYKGRDLSISPTLILLDLKLPKVNGFEVLRRIREDVRTRCIPVVIFTSSTVEQDILDCYNLGANSYICKPVDFNHFCDTLKQVISYWFCLDMTLMP